MNQSNNTIYLLLVLALGLSFIYTYDKGLYDGEWKYKHSNRMYLALKSAYHFGYQDAKECKPEDWDGPTQ